jgi:hypothetical protein
MAIADESYFDWPELPEAPSELNASQKGTAVQLTWKMHGGHPESVIIERRAGQQGKWQSLPNLPANSESFSDSKNSRSESEKSVSYRVRARNAAGASAYSNVATLRE